MKKLLAFVKNNIDKVLHLCISYILVTYLGVLLPIWLAVLITFSVGIGKELYDLIDYGGFCWKDLTADGIGIILGVIQLCL